MLSLFPAIMSENVHMILNVCLIDCLQFLFETFFVAVGIRRVALMIRADTHVAFYVKVRWLCHVSVVTENVGEFLIKFPIIIVHKNSFSPSRYLTCVQTARRTGKF